jgi:hypothetical protein
MTGIALIVAFGVALVFPLSPSDTLAAASNISVCGSRQVLIAATGSGGAAAGNEADIFLIVNKSRSACTLKGFPELRFTSETSPFVKVEVHREASMIFAEPRPKLVVLAPRSVASFGLGFGTAANQRVINDSRCFSHSVWVELPRSNNGNSRFPVANDLNICGTGFSVEITPIEIGPSPQKQ